MSEDLLQLIAPEVAGEVRGSGAKVADHLRSAITLARLLSATATRPRVDSTELDLARAGRELAKCVRSDTLQVLQQLFFLHLEDRSGLGPWPKPTTSATQLWKGILNLERRNMGLALPSLPEPGESREDVALRILAAALCLGLSESESNNWRGHLAFTKQDPLLAEPCYRRALGVEAATFEERATAIAGVAGCMLDRGVVFLARDWLDRHLDLAAACPQLARLAGLARLAAGDCMDAGQLLQPEPRHSLPRVLGSLGDRVPSLRSVLAGSLVWKPGTAVSAATPRRISRSDYGASVLVIMCAPGASDGRKPDRAAAECRPVRWDLAASLGQPSEAWLDRQVAAPWTSGEPEQAIVAGADGFVGFTHDEDEQDEQGQHLKRTCLSTSAKAMALVPVTHQENGALLGWVRLEFEHWLVPDPGRLAALGRAARRAFVGVTPVCAAPSDRAATYDQLFADLMKGLSFGRRRWWGFVAEDQGPRFVATGGEALGDWETNPGGCAAVGKAAGMGELLKGPMVCMGGEQLMHGDSQDGLVVPVAMADGRGRPLGWVVVESTRALDLEHGFASSLMKRCQLAGPQLGLARFNHWHQARYGHSVHFSTAACRDMPPSLGQDIGGSARPPASTNSVFQQLARLGTHALREPVSIVGSPGVGKTVAGRLVLFQRGFEEVTEVSLRGMGGAELEAAIGDTEGTGVILKNGDCLEPEAHSALELLLGKLDGGRFVVTARPSTLDPGAWEGLEGKLKRNRIMLPELAQRRAAILPSFRLLLAKAARLERRIAPVLTSEAEGLLWRGEWGDGMRELADFAHRVVIFHDADVLDGPATGKLALALDVSLPRRLSSKHLDPTSLWSAIESTRKKCGAIHRGRAAALMGWDPDTLTAKLKAAGLGAQ
ncbi:MAG: hypothetical protein ACJAVJ_000736 [Planctomycetota bacterium]